MIEGHPLAPVGLPAEITHEAATRLAVTQRRHVLRTQVTLGVLCHTRLDRLEVLYVHIARETVHTDRGEFARVETLGTVH